MKSQVYFVSIKAEKESLLKKLEKLYQKLNFSSLFDPGDLVGVKVHFGERGNTSFVKPIFIKPFVEMVKKGGGKPFLTDTNTLYLGGRFNAVEHLITAVENGFSFATMGVPIVIADGLTGQEYYELPVSGKHFREVKIAAAIVHSQALLVVSHFKGHGLSGFGGAIKNISMGFASRGGKQAMHSDAFPRVDEEKCTACGRCVKWCPAQAIFLKEKKDKKVAFLEKDKCYGCGECRAACLVGAVSIDWETDKDDFQEKMVEYALAAFREKKGKIGFVNFLVDISPDCDCWEYSDASIVPNIGILASLDPVALDQASLDLVNEAVGISPDLKADGKKNKFESLHGVSGERLLEYAQEVGLGSRSYEIIST
jgi:hypothetical protein